MTGSLNVSFKVRIGLIPPGVFMCSIFAVLDINGDLQALRQIALRQSRLMRHRGPDWSGIHVCEGAVLAHERLTIVDVNTGAQPLLSPDGKQSLAVNGEIYNHKQLRKSLEQPYEFATESDCEVILPLPGKGQRVFK